MLRRHLWMAPYDMASSFILSARVKEFLTQIFWTQMNTIEYIYTISFFARDKDVLRWENKEYPMSFVKRLCIMSISCSENDA